MVVFYDLFNAIHRKIYKGKEGSSQNWSICFFESGGLFHVNVCFYGLCAVRGWPASVFWSSRHEIEQVIMAQHIALWSATPREVAKGWTCSQSNGITIRKWRVQLHSFHVKPNEGLCDSLVWQYLSWLWQWWCCIEAEAKLTVFWIVV